MIGVLLTLAVDLVFDGRSAARITLRDFLQTPLAATPIVLFFAFGAAFVAAWRHSLAHRIHYWTAGAAASLLAVATVAVLGLIAGGSYLFHWILIWSLLSGYGISAWLFGAHAWRIWMGQHGEGPEGASADPPDLR